MNSSNECLISLRTNLAVAADAVAKIRYSPLELSHLAAAALACNSVELGTGIYHLADCKAKVGVPVLLRSLLESTMRLVLIAKEPTCGHLSLELIDNQERLKLIPKKSDESLSELFRSRNEVLEAEGAKGYSFFDLLSHLYSAHHDDWYNLYRVYSAFSHAQLSALAQHFFEPRLDGTNIHINKIPDEQLLVAYFSGADQLICITIETIGLIFNDLKR